MPFDPALEPVAAPLVVEIRGRLGYLVEVGLDYLALGRGSDTLSGGELQRARLAAQLGSGLVGVCYILDEPTAGLHPRDTDRLIASLRRLQELGNSLLVVEHDAAMIQAADWVVNLGPRRRPGRRRDRRGGDAGPTGRDRGLDHRQVPRPGSPARRAVRTVAGGWRRVRGGSKSTTPRSIT